MDDFLGSHLSTYHKNKEREKAIENLEKAKSLNRKVVFMKQGQSGKDWREQVRAINKYTPKENNYNEVRESDLNICMKQSETITKGTRFYLYKIIQRNINEKKIIKRFSSTHGSKEEAEAHIPVMQEEIRKYINELK